MPEPMPQPTELRAVTIGGRSSFLDPGTGEQFWVDTADATQAVHAGFVPENATAFLARKRRAALETPSAQIESAVLGAARGLSFGLSDLALRAISPEGARRAAELTQVHPTLSQTGEVVGAIGGYFLPGGPLRALSGSVRAGAGALTGGLAAGGKVAQIAGRVATGAGVAAAEGAAIGAGSALSELALSGETKDFLDRLVERSETGALTGLAMTGILGATGAALKGVARASQAAGQRMAKATGLPTATGVHAEAIVAKGQTDIATLREAAGVIQSDAERLAKVSTPRVRDILSTLRQGAEDIQAAGGETALRNELRDLTFAEARKRGLQDIVATGGFVPTSGVAPHALQIELGKLYTEIGRVGKQVRASTGVDLTAGQTGFAAGGSRLASALADEAGYRLGGKLGAKLARFVAGGGVTGHVLGSPQLQTVAKAGSQVARLGADALAVAMAGEIRSREAHDATFELPAAPEHVPERRQPTDDVPQLPALLAERQQIQQTLGDLPLEATADRTALTDEVRALSDQIRSRVAASATAHAIRGGGTLEAVVGSMAGQPGDRSLAEGPVADILVGSLISGQRGPVVELLTGRRAKGAERQLQALAYMPPIDERALEAAKRALDPLDPNEYQADLSQGYAAGGYPVAQAQALAAVQAGRLRYLKQRLQGGPVDAWRALAAARDLRGPLARVALGTTTTEDLSLLAEALPRLRVQLQLIARQIQRTGRPAEARIETALIDLAGGRFARRERAAGVYVQRNIFGNAPTVARQRQRPLQAAQIEQAAPVSALASRLGGHL